MKYDELVSKIGGDSAEKLCRQHGGETIYIPSLAPLMREKICKLWFDEGLPAGVIAERVGCSARYVRGVVGK